MVANVILHSSLPPALYISFTVLRKHDIIYYYAWAKKFLFTCTCILDSIHEVDQFQVIDQTTPHLVIDKKNNSTIFSITQPSTYPLRWGLSNNNLVLLARSLETLFQLSLFLGIHFLYFRLYRCIALTENGLTYTLAFSTLSLLITIITIAALRYSSITFFAALTTNSPIFKAVQCAISYIYYSEKWLSWSKH